MISCRASQIMAFDGSAIVKKLSLILGRGKREKKRKGWVGSGESNLIKYALSLHYKEGSVIPRYIKIVGCTGMEIRLTPV